MPATAGYTEVLKRLGSSEPYQRPWVRQPLLAYPVASLVELQSTPFRAAPCQAASSFRWRVTSALADQQFRLVEHSH